MTRTWEVEDARTFALEFAADEGERASVVKSSDSSMLIDHLRDRLSAIGSCARLALNSPSGNSSTELKGTSPVTSVQDGTSDVIAGEVCSTCKTTDNQFCSNSFHYPASELICSLRRELKLADDDCRGAWENHDRLDEQIVSLKDQLRWSLKNEEQYKKTTRDALERVSELEKKLNSQASSHGLYITQNIEPKINELTEENDRLRKVLEFYATNTNYMEPADDEMTPMELDFGQIARDALNQGEE